MRVLIQVCALHPAVIQGRQGEGVHLWGEDYKGALLDLVSLVLVVVDQTLTPCRRCRRSRLAVGPQIWVQG